MFVFCRVKCSKISFKKLYFSFLLFSKYASFAIAPTLTFFGAIRTYNYYFYNRKFSLIYSLNGCLIIELNEREYLLMCMSWGIFLVTFDSHCKFAST